MEEKAKKVNMKVEDNKEVKKLSYEDLEKIANQLSNQCQQLYAQLQRANNENILKRLDCLFRVVENEKSFSTSFTKKCTDEIQKILTIPEEVKSEKSNNDEQEG